MSKGVVSILGCGWLGKPLALELIKYGYKVKGSTTSEENLLLLKNLGIDPYLVHLPENTDSLKQFFIASRILIIAVPPGRTPEKNKSYENLIDETLRSLPNTQIVKVIYISSTSVFENGNQILNENDKPSPKTVSGKILFKTEERILSLPNVKSVVVRPAGLIGPGRHPGRFFAGKKDVENGLSPVNLIHMDDVISIITQLVIADESGVFNLASADHPTKKEFYSYAAKHANLPEPDFKNELLSWKIINSCRIGTELPFKSRYPNIFSSLDFC